MDMNVAFTDGMRRLRQTLALLLGFVGALGLYVLMLGAFEVPAENVEVMWAVFAGLATVFGWWNAQSDNRKAEAAGDKTLIVTSWARDFVVVIVSLLSAATVLGLFQIAAAGLILAGGGGGLGGWLIGRHFWIRAPLPPAKP